MIPKKILNKLESFLKSKSRSSDGGGFAEVKPNDIEALHGIIRAIVEAKYEGDADGDRPIDWKLIDRTKFEPMHFFAVPYDHKAQTDEEREQILDLHLTNLRISSDRLDTQLKIRRMHRHQEANKGASHA